MTDSLAGLRVLVVEDELMVSLLIEDILSAESCVIVGPFAGLEQALECARRDELDVGVLDVNIRGTLVFPVAEVLTQRGIPFVLLTGYGKSVLPKHGLDWPVCSKPFKPKDLVGALSSAVQGAVA